MVSSKNSPAPYVPLSSYQSHALTTQVCFELLYQPLTLLDCLHTFCGSCLQEWFAWQSTDNAIYSCPACRAHVRSTKQNATVTTLLDMFLRTRPDLQKSQEERERIAIGYRPGDDILPVMRGSVGEDRRRRHERDDGGVDATQRVEGAARHARRRRERESGQSTTRHRAFTDTSSPPSTTRLYNAPVQPLGHSTSLRSIISNSVHSDEIVEPDIREEIIQQIEEEGMLDGIDIDNLTPAMEEEFSERIVRAYYRRVQQDHARRAALRSTYQADSARRRHRHDRNDAELTDTSGSIAGDGPTRRQRPSRSTRPHEVLQSPRETLPFRDRSARLRSASRTDQSRGQGHQISTSASLSPSAPIPIPNTAQTSLSRHGYAHSPSMLSTSAASDRSPRSLNRSRARIESMYSPSRPIHSLEQPVVTATRPAPILICAHCSRPNIQFSLHYHCSECRSDDYDICITCYRRGRGCEAYTGPAHNYFPRYLKSSQSSLAPYAESEDASGLILPSPPRNTFENEARPHVLLARRFRAMNPTYPASISSPQSASSQRSSGQDTHLEEGLFCDICSNHADEQYWHCEVCNDGSWGFCNACVQKGSHCSHPLFAVQSVSAHLAGAGTDLVNTSELNHPRHDTTNSHQALDNASRRSNMSRASLPHVPDPSLYMYISLTCACDICHTSIPADMPIWHCKECNSSNADFCSQCIRTFSSTTHYDPPASTFSQTDSQQSTDVGAHDSSQSVLEQSIHDKALYKCPANHLTSKVVLTTLLKQGTKATRRTATCSPSQSIMSTKQRYASTDTNGKRALALWSYIPASDSSMRRGEESSRSAVSLISSGSDADADADAASNDVANANANACSGASIDPNASVNANANANLNAARDASDELLFPRNATLFDVVPLNAQWSFGTYAGAAGVFPSAYCRMLE